MEGKSIEEEVIERIRSFRSRVNISLRSAGPLLGVSHSTLNRWMDEACLPYAWTAEAVTRRLDIFDNEDKRSGLYTRMTGMDHKDRVEALHKVLLDHTDQ